MSLSRRTFVQQSAALAAAYNVRQRRAWSEDKLSKVVPHERPDILFISIDDLNDWPSPFSGPKPTIDPLDVWTPNLARIQDIGTVFQRAYCASPMCGPSRSATLTGLPPHISGVTQQENILWPIFGPLLVEPKTTLPRILQGGGYQTYGAGKIFHGQGYANEDTPFPGCTKDPWHQAYDACAWDDYKILSKRVPNCSNILGPPLHGDIADAVEACTGAFNPEKSMLPDARVARYGVDILSAVKSSEDAPLFLALGFFKPHKPWQAPAEFFKLYPYESLADLDAHTEKLDQKDLTLHSCSTLRDSRNSPTPDNWEGRTKMVIQGYLACISYVDFMLGAVLDAALARPRRTIIVLWSDHGYFMGEKRNWKKPALFERACRTPLMIADTGNPNPQSTFRLASLTDIFPTLLDYAGILDPLQHGVSLRPLVEDQSATWEQTSVVTTFNFKSKNGGGDFPDTYTKNADLVRCMEEQSVTIKSKGCLAGYPARLAGASHALRTQRPGEQYRFIRAHDTQCFSYKENPKTPLPYDELYDLENDPAERINLLAPDNITSEAKELASALSSELSDKLK